MVNQLAGTWVFESSDNFDAFLKEVGVNIVLRKVSKTVVPTLIIEANGDKWSVNMRSTFKNKDDEFVIGVEKDDVTMDGRKVRVLRRIEGDKLVTEQRDRSSGNIHVLSEMYVDSDGQMIEQLRCNNVQAIRKHKRKQ